MCEPGCTPFTATDPRTRNDPTVSSKAELNTTTTARSKPKRRTKKYRAIERPDGIIVEHPRYRPIDSSQKPTRKFEAYSITSNHIGPQHERKEGASSINTGHDLMGMGMSFCAVSTDIMGNDGYIGFPGRGRGGYNEEPTREHKSFHATANRSEQQLCQELTPMARFLGERGPWSSFSLQEDSKELWGLQRFQHHQNRHGNAAG